MMNKIKYFRFSPFVAGLVFFLLFSCQEKKERIPIDVSAIPKPEVHIKNYGKALFSIPPEDLRKEIKKLQKKYPFFLQGDLDDTLNIIRLTDFITTDYIRESFTECQGKYHHLSFLKEGIETVFQRNKYIFPDFSYPQVYTYISGFDPERQVANFDSVMIIALDMYLGPKYEAYRKFGFPEYKIRFLDKAYMLRDFCVELNRYRIPGGNDFLSRAIYEGKNLILSDALLPGVPDTIKIKYSQKQWQWIKAHEKDLWAFIIENDILYSTDSKIIQKFFVDAPFSSYFGQESPPRLGQWLGWKIVRKYFDTHPETPLNRFIRRKDAQKILQESGYRPE